VNVNAKLEQAACGGSQWRMGQHFSNASCYYKPTTTLFRVGFSVRPFCDAQMYLVGVALIRAAATYWATPFCKPLTTAVSRTQVGGTVLFRVM